MHCEQRWNHAVAATLDNTASTSDTNAAIAVGGTLFETLTVAAGASQNISVAPISNGTTVIVSMTDASGNNNNLLTATDTANCPSIIDSWDCANNSGLIQTREDTAAGIVNAGVLNPANGTINTIWTLSNKAAGLEITNSTV
ncbi:MAG: hypothetical protein CM15mP49_15350 [Actinomycetota bacterium]|nr:MAG: hypothetical protein CM15mP49_15350 [Actinomycetota bacterium]